MNSEQLNNKILPQLFSGMTFHLRPCSARFRIRKALEDSGGIFAKEMNKKVIRLTDSLTDTNGCHIDFIIHSVDRKELQDISKYQLPAYSQKGVADARKIKVPLDLLKKARRRFTPEEDEAILRYVSKFHCDYGEIGSVGGNLIWRNMEKKHITLHSWQSMKDRYFKHLVHCPPKFTYEPLTSGMYEGERIVCLSELFNTSNEKKKESQEKVLPMNLQKNKLVKENVSRRKLYSKKQQWFSPSFGMTRPHNNNKSCGKKSLISHPNSSQSTEVKYDASECKELALHVDDNSQKSSSEESVDLFITCSLTEENHVKLDTCFDLSDTKKKKLDIKTLDEDGIMKCKKSKLDCTEDTDDLTTSDDGIDSFDSYLLSNAKCIKSTPKDVFVSSKVDSNKNGPCPMYICPCKLNYGGTFELFKRIDDTLEDDDRWKSIRDELLVDEISLKYGISSKEVMEIMENHYGGKFTNKDDDYLGDSPPQLFEGLIFYMRPSLTRSHIIKLLEDNGGVLAKQMNKSVIKLTDSFTDSCGYHTDFIKDSVDRKELQDISKYQLPAYRNKPLSVAGTIKDLLDNSKDFSEHLTPENRTNNNSKLRQLKSCDCPIGVDYVEPLKLLRRIDNTPKDDILWKSLKDQILIGDIALKYGITSDGVMEILNSYNGNSML